LSKIHIIFHFIKRTVVLFSVFIFLYSTKANEQIINSLNILPHDLVHWTTLDSYGYLWIATGNGLCRYDGIAMQVFSKDDEIFEALRNSNISKVFIDSSNFLWAINSEGRIFSIDLNNMAWKLFKLGNDSTFTDLYSFGEKVIAIKDNNIFQCKQKEFSNEKMKITFADLPKAPIVSVLYYDQNTQFIAIKNLGLFQIHKSKAKQVCNHIKDINTLINYRKSICFYSNQRIYLYDIPKMNCKDITPKGIYLQDAFSLFQRFFIDQDQKILISTFDGIFRFDTSMNSIQNPEVVRINLGYRPPQSGEVLTSYIHDANGTEFFGFFNAGLIIRNKRKNPFHFINSFSENKTPVAIQSLALDSAGFLYAGSSNRMGLHILDHKLKIIKHYSQGFEKQHSFRPGSINGIAISNNNSFWISFSYNQMAYIQNNIVQNIFVKNGIGGYANAGVKIFDDKTYIITLDKGIQTIDKYGKTSTLSMLGKHKLICNDMLLDGDLMYIADNEKGLIIFNTKDSTYKIFNSKQNKNQAFNSVRCIYKQHINKIWIGTSTGIHLYNTKTELFTSYSKTDGLPDNRINAIVSDKEGNLWINTENGLALIDTSETVHAFNADNGFYGSLLERNSLVYDSKRNMVYTGGIKGLIYFHPDSILIEKMRRKVVISKLEAISGTDYLPIQFQRDNTNEKIKLSYQQNSIVLYFNMPEFSYPKSIKYHYLLEGYDKHFITTDAYRAFSKYTNLQPGKYVFKVSASMPGKGDTSISTQLNIEILPPFYATLWFKLLVSLLFLFAIAILIKKILSRIRKNELVLIQQIEIQDSKLKEKEQRIHHQSEVIKQLNENKKKALIDKANLIILENLEMEGLNSAFLSEKLNLSKTTFYNLVKELSGKSVNIYIREIRLDRARQLLSSGRFGVSEVAFSCGFNDISYFSKCYKNKFGLPPSKDLHNTENELIE